MSQHREGGYFLRPLPQYRDDGHWPAAEPERAETACDLIVWYARHPWATCSYRTAVVLATLEREWGCRPSAHSSRA